MQNIDSNTEQTIAALKIRFFDFRDEAERHIAQLENALRTIMEAAGAQNVDGVLEALKKENPEEDQKDSDE